MQQCAKKKNKINNKRWESREQILRKRYEVRNMLLICDDHFVCIDISPNKPLTFDLTDCHLLMTDIICTVFKCRYVGKEGMFNLLYQLKEC